MNFKLRLIHFLSGEKKVVRRKGLTNALLSVEKSKCRFVPPRESHKRGFFLRLKLGTIKQTIHTYIINIYVFLHNYNYVFIFHSNTLDDLRILRSLRPLTEKMIHVVDQIKFHFYPSCYFHVYKKIQKKTSKTFELPFSDDEKKK
jgi:hypothetical protein